MRKTRPKSYEYIEKLLPKESDLMLCARENSEKIGLGVISLSATEASIIEFYLKSIHAKKVVEVGTLTGLSALYILRALPKDGYLWTLEKSDEHVKLAREVLKDERCTVVVGDAEVKLKELVASGPFDAIFIDGNKAAYLDYFDWAVENVNNGGLIFVDNIFLAGAVWGDQTLQRFNEKQVRVVQTMNEKAFSTDNLISVVIPTEEGLLICKKQS